MSCQTTWPTEFPYPLHKLKVQSYVLHSFCIVLINFGCLCNTCFSSQLWAPQGHHLFHFLTVLLLEFENFSSLDTITVIRLGTMSHHFESKGSKLKNLHQQFGDIVRHILSHLPATDASSAHRVLVLTVIKVITHPTFMKLLLSPHFPHAIKSQVSCQLLALNLPLPTMQLESK